MVKARERQGLYVQPARHSAALSGLVYENFALVAPNGKPIGAKRTSLDPRSMKKG